MKALLLLNNVVTIAPFMNCLMYLLQTVMPLTIYSNHCSLIAMLKTLISRYTTVGVQSCLKLPIQIFCGMAEIVAIRKCVPMELIFTFVSLTKYMLKASHHVF